MRKYIEIEFNNSNKIITIHFTPDDMQEVSPKKVEDTYIEYFCVWDTELLQTDNLYLLERELNKAQTIYDNHDFRNIIVGFLISWADYEPQYKDVCKAFGSANALRRFLIKNFREE